MSSYLGDSNLPCTKDNVLFLKIIVFQINRELFSYTRAWVLIYNRKDRHRHKRQGTHHIGPDKVLLIVQLIPDNDKMTPIRFDCFQATFHKVIGSVPHWTHEPIKWHFIQSIANLGFLRGCKHEL